MQESHGGARHRHIPDYVAQYLARRVLADLPERVYETLISLSPEEIEVLDRVGAALDECEPHHVAAVVH